MTTRPTLIPASPGHPLKYTISSVDYNTEVLQQGNWAQEVLAGTNADKIPPAAVGGLVGYFPNLLVNGGMEVSQRGVGTFSIGGASSAQTLDRWTGVTFGTSTLGVTQVSGANVDATGSHFAAELNYVHGTSGSLYQKVENFAQFAGRTVFLTARVKSASTGCYLQLADGTNTAVSARTVAGAGYATLIASLTLVAAPTLLQVAIQLDTATAFTYVDSVMLTMSLSAIDYVQQNPAEEMLRCQRWYQKVTSTQRYRAAVADTHEVGFAFPVPMAATPTGVLTAGTRLNVASSSIAGITTTGARHFITSSAAGDTQAIGDIGTFECNL